MIIFNSIAKAYQAYQQYAERAAALKQLRQLSARQLADIGIEPHQLTGGVAAYPWRNQAVDDHVVTQNDQPAEPAKNIIIPLADLYSAWGRPARQW